jgi:NADH:ubiquinone oxidoreductase subunit 2 (subunit N)
VYYLRVAKTVCIDAEPESRGPVSIGFLPAIYVFALAVPVFLLGILPQVTELANQASEQLLR